MDNILNLETVNHFQCLLNGVEECGFNGDYMLPEYCPDIAVVLKCMAFPRLQSRQFSGDKLLLDGVVNLRVLYLDEERRHIHSVEFSVPYSCVFRVGEECNAIPVMLDFATKYVNCRATNPRRIEVHGAVQVNAQAYGNKSAQIAVPGTCEGLHTRCDSMEISELIGMAEKVVTVSEVLEFPETLPAAEMLLGGTCTVLAKEWKVLTGKVIVRGVLLIHQLYTDDQETGTTNCLDFEVPFSQILDVSGVREGHLCCGDIQILTDTERCLVGPDGGNTLLEITAKMMIHLYAYECSEMPLLLEAYHRNHPVEQEFEEIECKAFCGCRYEQTVLPMAISMPEQPLQELVDVWVQPQNAIASVEHKTATIVGTLTISALGKDREGEIVYFEKTEEYRLEYPCVGNEAQVKVNISEIRYRSVDGKLEIQVGLCVWLCQYQTTPIKVVRSLRINSDQSYPQTKAGVILYYAQAGESLWEIARDCHTSPELIRAENETIAETIMSPCVLLLPIV